MDRIKLLFIQDKKIKNREKVVTLGDIIDKEVPDTYDMDYITFKENVIEKVEQFQPQIIFVCQSKTFDVLGLIRRLKEISPNVVIFASVTDNVKHQQEMMKKLIEAGAYKCYYSAIIVETLVHDMFVALNME